MMRTCTPRIPAFPPTARCLPERGDVMQRIRLAVVAIASMFLVNWAHMSQPLAADATGLPATETLDALAKGSTTSEDLIRLTLERLRARPDLNAIITLNPNAALTAATGVDAARRSRQPLGLLAGLPIVVKDNIHVTGMPSTAGTPGLKDFVPAANAPVVQKLIDAGAIVVAKTNMHELAF